MIKVIVFFGLMFLICLVGIIIFVNVVAVAERREAKKKERWLKDQEPKPIDPPTPDWYSNALSTIPEHLRKDFHG